MTDVLAVHHIDDVLADILRMVADALEGPDHPHHIERTPDGAWIFIMNVMHCRWIDSYSSSTRRPWRANPQGRLDIHAREGIQGVVHHVRHHPSEVLDLAVLVCRALHVASREAM